MLINISMLFHITFSPAAAVTRNTLFVPVPSLMKLSQPCQPEPWRMKGYYV